MDRLALALDRYEQDWGRNWVAANIRREALKYAAVTVCSLAGGFLLGDTLYKAVF